MKKYIFRLDDISWDMNWDNFNRIRELFIKYNIRPVIGVIPDNKDVKLIEQSKKSECLSKNEFWKLIKLLQNEYDWTIAMHGLHHLYETKESGIIGRNNRQSEFAGLPLDVQKEKIRMGREILEKHNIRTDVFMAPSHSFDHNTLLSLADNNITVITDGLFVFPQKNGRIIFVPQQWPWPHGGLWGIETVALHTNTWGDSRFLKLEKFINKNVNRCVDFGYAIGYANNNEYGLGGV